MSFVSIVPEILSTAADNLQSVGSRSALTAMQFAAHAYAYQTVSAQAAAIHQMFVTMLAAGAGSYAATEAANAVATG
jgi:hypothetical protein